MRNASFKRASMTTVFALLVAGGAQAQVPPSERIDRSAPSREVVRADLRAWKQAGLADAWRGENTPNLESTEYRAMHQRYLQLSGQQIGSASAASRSPGMR